LLNYQNCPNLD